MHIDVWYGKHQVFGRNGLPQRWVNILGRVYGPVKTLHAALNGSPLVPLSIGPDERRLVAVGDFNVDLDSARLKIGDNTVELVAVGEDGQQISQQVIVTLVEGSCSLPYTIDWNTVTNIQDVAQVVDGQWSINNGSISPEEIGYDRLIAIGDANWQDYEVTVPITVHGINGNCYQYPSVHAGVGIVMRWRGHYSWGKDQWASGQPAFGYTPFGSICWHCVFHETGPELNFFDTECNRPVRKPYRLTMHTPYIFKVRVQSLSNHISQYSLKVWQDGTPEPAAWDLVNNGTLSSLPSGSFVLGAHEVAASFGSVHVIPL